jgi:hypothetical protein
MTTSAPTTWVEKFRNQSNSDAELQANGKFYSCAFLLFTKSTGTSGKKRLLICHQPLGLAAIRAYISGVQKVRSCLHLRSRF